MFGMKRRVMQQESEIAYMKARIGELSTDLHRALHLRSREQYEILKELSALAEYLNVELVRLPARTEFRMKPVAPIKVDVE